VEEIDDCSNMCVSVCGQAIRDRRLLGCRRQEAGACQEAGRRGGACEVLPWVHVRSSLWSPPIQR